MFRTFEPFDPYTHIDANAALRQGIIPVANAQERNEIPDPDPGMRVYRRDIRKQEEWNGTTWVSANFAPGGFLGEHYWSGFANITAIDSTWRTSGDSRVTFYAHAPVRVRVVTRLKVNTTAADASIATGGGLVAGSVATTTGALLPSRAFSQWPVTAGRPAAGFTEQTYSLSDVGNYTAFPVWHSTVGGGSVMDGYVAVYVAALT